MKHKNINFYVTIIGLTFVLIFLQLGVNADVTTSGELHKDGNVVYVAGNDDFYPIEYYNNKTGKYEGIMPKIIEDISKRTGIDFIYLKNGSSQAEIVQNLQAEVVSAYITNSKADYISEAVDVFAFKQSGKKVQIGWGFTEIADEKLISTMRQWAEKLSGEEINGYLISTESENPQDASNVAATIVSIIILVGMAGIVLRIKKKGKKALNDNRMTDPDTGIGNLLYFEHLFRKLITGENRSLYYIGYISIDSNYLQVYHGENIFKDAIRFTANTLKTNFTGQSFAAKTSENGFAFAFSAANKNDAGNMVNDIICKLNSYIDSSEGNEKKYFYATVYNLEQNDTNCEVLLYNLRKKCNEIINTERQIIYCDNSIMNSITAEKELFESILRGLKNNEFKLYVQFVVDNKTKKIVSAEALSRWDSPQQGLISPGKYISAMEKSGHINILDYYMFEACCRQLHKWQGTEFDSISLSCNITRSTLSEVDFLDKITDIMKRYVFNKEKLFIEITEETIEKSFERATENVRACKKLGIGISLDDMGTGYTTLSNLCDYPIDIVKIDREILLKANTQNGKGLFEGIIALSHSLKMKVICEGVETQEQKEFIDKTDCDMIQGWYYSHVFPIREGEEFAKACLNKI